MAKQKYEDLDYISKIISAHKTSPVYRKMLEAENYYKGNHEILGRERYVLDENGAPVPLATLPNNKVVNNRYAQLVDQKVNYIVGNPFRISTESKKYEKILKKILNNSFKRTLKRVTRDALNHGVGWIHVYINKNNKLCFKRFPGYEIIPVWIDEDAGDLDFVVRVFKTSEYNTKKEIEKKELVEVYTEFGRYTYEYADKEVKLLDKNPSAVYEDNSAVPGLWSRVPVVPFSYFDSSITMLDRIKSIQDAINSILSTFLNNIEEDPRSTLLVVTNYDGTDLTQLKQDMAQIGIIQTRTVDGIAGDVKALAIEVNAENFSTVLEYLDRIIIDNGRGFDAKFLSIGSDPNQMNIQSMYSTIDLDTNGAELEYNFSFDMLLELIDDYLKVTKQGDFSDIDADIIFDRDILVNESQKIENINKSEGVVSAQTLREQHPYAADDEEERIKKEQEEELHSIYGGMKGAIDHYAGETTI